MHSSHVALRDLISGEPGRTKHNDLYLSFIYPEREGFGEIFPEVMIIYEGNIITEENISPNPPSGGSINDVLYRKSKTSVRINF